MVNLVVDGQTGDLGRRVGNTAVTTILQADVEHIVFTA